MRCSKCNKPSGKYLLCEECYRENVIREEDIHTGIKKIESENNKYTG